jgi:hypothetical protein
VGTAYALVAQTGVMFNGDVPTTMTVTSVLEPASAATLITGLITVLVLRCSFGYTKNFLHYWVQRARVAG